MKSSHGSESTAIKDIWPRYRLDLTGNESRGLGKGEIFMGELGGLERYWRWLIFLAWLTFAAIIIYSRWGPINAFALGDTDDNMRIMQVRALLAGQDWYDLRQYRLDPPFGADIHWSRLVDLPIAGLKLALAPVLGGAAAERAAVAVAPLLP